MIDSTDRINRLKEGEKWTETRVWYTKLQPPALAPVPIALPKESNLVSLAQTMLTASANCPKSIRAVFDPVDNSAQ